MASTNRAINPTVKLPIEVKPFVYNRRLCATIPQDIAKLLDIHEDNAILEATIIEGGLAFYVKRPRGVFE